MAEATTDAATPPGGTYRRSAFGLTFESDLDLPELDQARANDAADVRIRCRPIDRPRPNASRSAYIYSESEQLLYWPEVGMYLISGAGCIDIEPTPGVSEALLRLPLLGPVMALLLHLRGSLVLHASAVRIGGRLVVFMGDKGAGKSTAAAAALQRGHTFFTDDLLALHFTESRPLAWPGYPSVKLASDSARIFQVAGARELEAPAPDFPKRVQRVEQSGERIPLGPSHIYILRRGDSASITPCAAEEALQLIMRYAYVPLFDGKPWLRDEATRFFQQCALLARTNVAVLQTPRDLNRLGEALSLVEGEALSNG